MEASADISIRIALHLVAAAVSFASSLVIVARRTALGRADYVSAAVLFWTLLAADVTGMLAPAEARLPAYLAFAVYLLVLAGAVFSLKRGARRGVVAFALAVVFKVIVQYLLLRGYDFVLEWGAST